MPSENHIIAIDGPAGSGKSTTARMVAEKLKFLFLDTGAMYRAVGLEAIRRGISLDNGAELEQLAAGLKIRFVEHPDGQRVYIGEDDITAEIRTPRASDAASRVSVHTGVRRHLVARQKQIGSENNIVAEGRDTTSVVFPNATLKVYLRASIIERARRRLKDLQKAGIESSLEEQMAEIKLRDERDSGREDSPLMVVPDAEVVDTTELTIEQQVDKIISLYKEKIGK